MLKIIRIIFRLSLLSAHIVTGVLLAFIFLTPPLKKLNLYNEKTLIRKWLYLTGYFTGCKITSKTHSINHPTLLISNHVSWLDILILGGLYDVHFLSKEEVKKWPVIGFLTVISGTLLIKRGKGSEGANEEIHHALKQGDSVCFFPEGTTSNGEKTKHFHSRLYKAAYLANSSISIMSLSYSTDNKKRDLNMGWEKQSFFEHLFYVLGHKRSYVRVNFVEKLKDFHDLPRKKLAYQSQNLINNDLKNNHFK